MLDARLRVVEQGLAALPEEATTAGLQVAGYPASWQRLVSQFEAKVHSLLTDTVNEVAGRRCTGVAVRLLVRAQCAFYSQPVQRHPQALGPKFSLHGAASSSKLTAPNGSLPAPSRTARG
jgi:hypothetical protein